MMTEEQYKEAESFWNKKDAQVFSLSSIRYFAQYIGNHAGNSEYE